MKSIRVVAVVLLLVAAMAAQTGTMNQLLPAGMIIPCTMNEPNFSLKTVEVGDPVLCYLPTVMSFGQPLFPRGSFLTGALTDGDKPGHFWGKGSLTIQFDRLILPDAVTLPVTVKVIGLPKGKGRVTPDGRIVGKGHTKKDTAGWIFLPPIQLLNTPRRGPFPTLKGNEERLLLRVMADTFIPVPANMQKTYSGYYAVPSAGKPQIRDGGDVIIVKRDHTAVSVVDYWYETPEYVSFAIEGHRLGRIPVREIDLKETARVNLERGIDFRIAN